MSLNTYAGLLTAAADWLARSDLTSYIPDFYVMGETRIFYGSSEKSQFPSAPLRIREMQTSADITFSAQSAALPTGFLGMIRLYLDVDPKITPTQMTPAAFWRKHSSNTASRPTDYTIEGTNILLGPSPDSTYTGKALYYKAFDPIATASPVTWLMTNAPSVYLYAALLEAAPFIRNDIRLPTWHTLFKGMLEGLNDSSDMARLSGPLVSQTDVYGG